jgi:hypothetical protein
MNNRRDNPRCLNHFFNFSFSLRSMSNQSPNTAYRRNSKISEDELGSKL